MAILSQSSRIGEKNMLYIPKNVLRNVSAKGGDFVDFVYLDKDSFIVKIKRT